jgi:adenylate cyclase
VTGRELLSRFRRTKVAQWCAVYLAATWVLLEVAAFMADWFDLPAVVVRVLTAVLATGFGVALVIAWYHGEKGRQSVGRSEALLLGLLTMTAIAAGVLVARPAAVAGTAPKMALDPARVAVLYVEDFSAGRDLNYIADSFTESLTYELSQIDGLDVVSRTGVKAYRDTAIPVDSIARLLQAGTLVESSIEAIGDELRVTVQLISGATGSHIASERITRSGTDLIRLREELVQKVVLLLRRQLGREIQLRDQRLGTQSGVAWSCNNTGRGGRERLVVALPAR